jgi:hypothetical protein
MPLLLLLLLVFRIGERALHPRAFCSGPQYAVSATPGPYGDFLRVPGRALVPDFFRALFFFAAAVGWRRRALDRAAPSRFPASSLRGDADEAVFSFGCDF